ncbi:MAG: CBS domain-containing protein [Chloroflexales bacterium]|nr:CBS domain-containing protein [Chloroflexales bacterium]
MEHSANATLDHIEGGTDNRKVGDLMHSGVLTCQRDTPIQDVARQMSEQDVSALVVVDSKGNMAGLISRTDLVNARLYEQYWKHWRGLTAGHIMVTDVVSVHADDTIQHAGKLMMDRKIHRVVVVEEQGEGAKPTGVLSITDLVRDMAQE